MRVLVLEARVGNQIFVKRPVRHWYLYDEFSKSNVHMLAIFYNGGF